MATILTKRSNTASSVPVAGDLTNSTGGAELAVNTADKRLFTKDSGGTVVELGTNPSSITLASGTANAVPYLNGSKVLTSGSALTFDGTNLGIGTSSPASNLDVSATTNAVIRLSSTKNDSSWNVDTDAFGKLEWYSADTSGDASVRAAIWALPPTTNGNNSNLTFYTKSSTGSYPTEKMRLDYSGNLGLGVTPSAWSTTVKAFDIGYGAIYGGVAASTSTTVAYNSYYSGTDWIYKGSTYASRWSQSAGQHQWYTAPSGTAGNAISFTQAMTLDASGNLLVGTTTSGRTDTNGTAIDPTGIVYQNHVNGTASGSFYTRFSLAATQIGSIAQSGTTSVAYNTSSDYRLKNTIAPMTGALAKVAALKPVTYKWNADGSDGEGFIAHELQAVCPDAVTGEKDAVDAEGKPVYQGIDTSFLVATLTAAIQELKAEVDALKSEINTLKGI